jgi:hypothetical protein
LEAFFTCFSVISGLANGFDGFHRGRNLTSAFMTAAIEVVITVIVKANANGHSYNHSYQEHRRDADNGQSPLSL